MVVVGQKRLRVLGTVGHRLTGRINWLLWNKEASRSSYWGMDLLSGGTGWLVEMVSVGQRGHVDYLSWGCQLHLPRTFRQRN